MNAPLKAALEAVLYIVIYLLLQVVCYACAQHICRDAVLAVVIASCVSSVVVVLLFVFLRWSEAGLPFVCRRSAASVLPWCCLLGISLILPLQYVEDFLPFSMPDKMEDMFRQLINHGCGYLVLGIIGPVAEEVVFRGAVLRKLLSLNCRTWVAIVVSAVIFGAVHGNLAQFSHAFIVGLLLGWLYARTRSIVPCVAVHWVNNTLAYTITRLFPDRADDSIISLFDGNTPLLCVSLTVSVAVAALALWRVIVSVEKYRRRW